MEAGCFQTQINKTNKIILLLPLHFNEKIMDKENILSNFQEKAKNAAPIGGTIKFEIDGNAICIDGTGSENKILLEDMEADCTITMAGSLMEDLKNGKVNPMMAVMSGKLKIKGDQGLAMKLQAFM